MLSSNIGLDHIAVYVPNQYLSSVDLAHARQIDPNKFTIGIGIKEISVPSPAEDVVVMAANAGYQVLQEAGVLPSEIGLLIVGTESAVDGAKPVAIQVHELLGIQSACRVYDTIHACIGATYGVLSALDWLAADSSRSYALVIASDIARYGKASPGEPTQGAGAVALLISRHPRLMTLQEISNYSKNVYDFWKPKEEIYPMVNGVYSAQCYLEAVTQCFTGLIINQKSTFLYHTPYPKLVQQAHTQVLEVVDSTIDKKPHYDKYVSCSSLYPSRVGNIYTGSLWLSLVSFLENIYASESNSLIELQEGCYLFSYGSGCSSVLMRGEFSANCREMVQKMKLSLRLEQRVQISVEEYEMLMYSPDDVKKNYLNTGYFKFEGIHNKERKYSVCKETVFFEVENG
ncbi:MAG TPA: hydroxymethylglutaryl-CoA synthase [Coxiellaceae bacterium]|nr:hydroxymethylglutaryl-CoA synthase [Coxiellaceae bacterium]